MRSRRFLGNGRSTSSTECLCIRVQVGLRYAASDLIGQYMMLLIPTYIIDSPAHTCPVPVSNYPRAVRRFGSTSCTLMRRACVPQVGVRDHVERDCVYAGACDVFGLDHDLPCRSLSPRNCGQSSSTDQHDSHFSPHLEALSRIVLTSSADASGLELFICRTSYKVRIRVLDILSYAVRLLT